MAHQVITTAAGTPVSQKPLSQLPGGAMAQSVTVTNNTNQYCAVGGVADPIPPWATGMVCRLSPPQPDATITWVTPGGITPQPLVAGQTATFTFTEELLAPSAPQSGFANPTPQSLLGSFSTTAGTTTTSQPITLPTGTQSLLVVWKSPTTTIVQPTSVTVLDGSETVEWGSFTTGTGTGGSVSDTILIVPVSLNVSPTVVIQVVEPAAVTHTVYVIALPQSAAVAATLQGSDVAINTVPPSSQLCKVAAVSGAFSGVGSTTATLGTTGGQSTADFTLPAGTTTVAITGTVPYTLAQGIPVFQLIGVQSGARYVLFQNGPLPLYANVSPADTTVRLVVLDGGLTSAEPIQCSASFAPLIVPPPTILPISVLVNLNLANGGSALVISGAPGYLIRLFTAHLAVDNNAAGGLWELQDTNAGSAFEMVGGLGAALQPNMNHPIHYGPLGTTLSVGGGLQLVNVGGAASEVRGSLTYVQQPAF